MTSLIFADASVIDLIAYVMLVFTCASVIKLIIYQIFTGASSIKLISLCNVYLCLSYQAIVPTDVSVIMLII